MTDDLTAEQPMGKKPDGISHRQIAYAVLRPIGATTALVTVYFLLPLDRSSTWFVILMLVIGLAALVTLVTFQVRWILTSPRPGVRAAEALATSIPLFLLLFSSTYFLLERISASDFSQPLTRTDALYFTVTVFSTVGFGDITPTSEAARRVVTVQMIADLLIIGVAIQAIVGAVKQRRQADTTTTDITTTNDAKSSAAHPDSNSH